MQRSIALICQVSKFSIAKEPLIANAGFLLKENAGNYQFPSSSMENVDMALVDFYISNTLNSKKN